MGKENANENNPFEGFSLLNADVLGDLDTNIEIKEEDLDDEALGKDTGIEEKPVEELETEVEIETEEVPENETSSIKVLAEFLGEKGIIDLPDDFEDSEEGLENAIQTRIEKEVNTYKENLGDISLKFIEFVENGGDPRVFIQTYSSPDYSKISDKDLESEDIQERLVREALYLDGYSMEEISEEIEDYKEGGILANKAKRARNRLVKANEEHQASLVEQQKRARVEEEKKRADAIKNLESEINSKTEIAGFEIKDKDKKNFFDFITKRDKAGKTELIKAIESDPDYNIKTAWLLYNKFDFSKVEKKVEKKQLASLKDKLDSAKSGGGKGAKEIVRTGNSNFSSFKKAL